jgi:hypothetical protein
MVDTCNARNLWHSGEHANGNCDKCGERGQCLVMPCDNPKCKKSHQLCEFCFVQSIITGDVSPMTDRSKATEESVESTLRDTLFGGD